MDNNAFSSALRKLQALKIQPFGTSSGKRPYLENAIFENFVPNVWFLVSDTGFSGRIPVCWRIGKIFSCQILDLNLS